MRTRLQLKLPIVLGIVLFCAHSLLVTALAGASLRNMEFGALWEPMRETDWPVSVLLDTFYDAYSKSVGTTLADTYHKPYFLFHLIGGGVQFFVWGWLVGILARRLLDRGTTHKRCRYSTRACCVTKR